MKLLNTYEDREQAEAAVQKISGEKRLASERDSTVVVYNLFGEPSWGNFYRLEMFDLKELKEILANRQKEILYDSKKHIEIIKNLEYVAQSFHLKIPDHWRC